MGELETMRELIESREYLLKSQKERLVEDLVLVPSGDASIEKVIDAIFYRLFGKGWDALTTPEQLDIKQAWRGV